jgi:DNA-directed RNA polymerase subunit M/transcription elongation factor TFIIS
LKQKNNSQFKERIITKEIDIDKLASMDVKDMASNEIQDRRKKAEEEGFKSRRSDWNAINGGQQAIGIYTCENCGKDRTSSFQLQIRGADEPMTT